MAASDPALSRFLSALQTGQTLLAVDAVRDMLREEMPLGRQWGAISQFAAYEGEWSLAIAAAERLTRANPTLDSQLNLASTLTLAGRNADALVLLRRLTQALPNEPRVAHFIGVALIESGESNEGIAALERALALFPQSGSTWLAWANAVVFTHDAPATARIAAMEPRFEGAADGARAPFLFALGKAFDDVGEHHRAFQAILEGARLTAAARGVPAASDPATFLPEPEWLERASHFTGEARAIFVTGLPRSGTTLVEQILASHRDVGDGGEINIAESAARAIGGSGVANLRRRFAATGDHANAWQAFNTRYAHLLNERFGPQGRVIDKSLNLTRQAALLRVAMPDAPLLWLRRNHFDTAWSSFKTYFAAGVEWSFDLAAIGRHHAIEDALFAFWHKNYGSRMRVVDYAELASDPISVIPILLAHCRLSEDPAVFRASESRRAIRTSSVAQVRAPIHNRAIGASAPYRKYLGDYEAAYQRQAEEFQRRGLVMP